MELGYQKEVSNRAKKRGTLPMKMAGCPNYSCHSFALIYHFSHLFHPCARSFFFSPRGGLYPWSLFPQPTFLFLIPSWQSVLFGHSFPHTYSTHLIFLYMSLCPSVGVSIVHVFKFQCTHSSYILPVSSTPVFAYSFSQTALLHFSHLTIQLFLATLSKLLPDPSLPLPRLSFSPQTILFLPLWHIFIILPFFSFFSLTPPFQTCFFHFLLLSFRNYYVVFFLISVSNSPISEFHTASDSNVDLRSVTRGGGDSISCWRQDSDFCSIVIIVVGKLSDKQHAVCFVL